MFKLLSKPLRCECVASALQVRREDRVWMMLHSGSRNIGNATGETFGGLESKCSVLGSPNSLLLGSLHVGGFAGLLCSSPPCVSLCLPSSPPLL